MSDGVITIAVLLGVVGIAAAILFVRDVVGKRFKKPLALIVNAIVRFVQPAVVATLVIVVGAALVGALIEHWGATVCWVNDATGILNRTCAIHKIGSQPSFNGAEIVEVTGIADVGGSVKRVEFKWRLKPSAQNPNPQPTGGSVTFRKYDDGWRPEGGGQ
jgi:hypothetical protein